MSKTIKTTKQMNLQELIKHVWDNGITDVNYTTQDGGARITFDADGDVETEFCIEKCDYFYVEVEEPIDEDTVFEFLVELDINGWVFTYDELEYTIAEIKDEETKRIYALIDGRLELMWERDGDE